MINIFRKIFLRFKGLDANILRKLLRLELTKIRHELEEHLQAINETTNEIVANYEYLSVLESKLDRLSDRVNQMQMHLELNSDTVIAKRNNFEVKKLNRIEQKVFLVIYTLEEEKGSVTYEDIAQKLKISEQLVGNYVTSLIGKGVPIMKRYLNSKPFLRLDPVFKTLQTKENILQLSLQEFGF